MPGKEEREEVDDHSKVEHVGENLSGRGSLSTSNPVFIQVKSQSSDDEFEDTKHLLADESDNIMNDQSDTVSTDKMNKNTHNEDIKLSEKIDNTKEGDKKVDVSNDEQEAEIHHDKEEKPVIKNSRKDVDHEEITKENEVVSMEMEEVDGIVSKKDIEKKTGTDEQDGMSVLSFFMEKDVRYYFQHPYVRLFIAYFVTFCNFLIYAEDPVAHSMKECSIPVVGNTFAFVCTRYPSNAFSLLKVVMWLIGLGVGLIVGKLLFHRFLFNRVLRLKMFSADKGSWLVMFLMTLVSLFIFSYIYNGFLMAGGDSTEPYRISPLLGLSNSIFMKAAACGTWCGDFFTAWMVTDMMLQEKLYPKWGVPVKKWWNRKYNRIILFWIATLLASFIVVFVIATDYIQWDKLNRDFLHSNELSRSFLAAVILVMDILIVCQDWDFPHFMSAIDIKMPGVNTAHIRFDIPKCLKKEVWQVHITGKWFNYGILFIVMLLDLNMWKNQIFYSPYDYGQYTDSEGRIYTVKDEYSLTNHNETLLSFAYRNSTINPLTNRTYISDDPVMNARYNDYGIGLKLIAFFPTVIAFITFGVLLIMFGRFKPTEDDPYAGRLMKRKKRRFSLRGLSNSFRKLELRRKVQAVPRLLHFRKRNPESFEKNNITDNGSSGFPENWHPPGDNGSVSMVT